MLLYCIGQRERGEREVWVGSVRDYFGLGYFGYWLDRIGLDWVIWVNLGCTGPLFWLKNKE